MGILGGKEREWIFFSSLFLVTHPTLSVVIPPASSFEVGELWGKEGKGGEKCIRKRFFWKEKERGRDRSRGKWKKSLKGFFFLLSSSLLTVFSFELSLSYESPWIIFYMGKGSSFFSSSSTGAATLLYLSVALRGEIQLKCGPSELIKHMKYICPAGFLDTNEICLLLVPIYILRCIHVFTSLAANAVWKSSRVREKERYFSTFFFPPSSFLKWVVYLFKYENCPIFSHSRSFFGPLYLPEPWMLLLLSQTGKGGGDNIKIPKVLSPNYCDPGCCSNNVCDFYLFYLSFSLLHSEIKKTGRKKFLLSSYGSTSFSLSLCFSTSPVRPSRE